ncbi:MAG TPA: tetratricopeptide repeat protein [Flavobacterium sp.]|uniref:tetratricopeptide repeat protein n=1 Tax=Flavobacterium sp. TaxID=239 RepID=UPI002BDF44D3|nr:tetratricopeptide repeat protein [Flavobacterium sp.]HSD13565.1 tetratricopeptide repeat protein [Flavobacterium sp.]
MNVNDLTYLISKPDSLTGRQTIELETVLNEFPYFQSARAIHLKGLHNQKSFRYNQELKKTAAYTTDRSVLFEFITSENFTSIHKAFLEEKETAINEIIVNQYKIVVPQAIEVRPKVNPLEQSILTSIQIAEPETAAEPAPTEPVSSENIQPQPVSSEEEKPKSLEEKLEIGKPLEFSVQEKHSFQEWLQLAKITPINRENEPQDAETDNEKKKKSELIDKFIESNPKIVSVKNAPVTPINIEKSTQDNSYLMTETLAKVYLEQKKYQKAIQAYEILILKYPEKSSFFADRISDIRLLQQNNN